MTWVGVAYGPGYGSRRDLLNQAVENHRGLQRRRKVEAESRKGFGWLPWTLRGWEENDL